MHFIGGVGVNFRSQINEIVLMNMKYIYMLYIYNSENVHVYIGYGLIIFNALSNSVRQQRISEGKRAIDIFFCFAIFESHSLNRI